jgi:hypothetical protein
VENNVENIVETPMTPAASPLFYQRLVALDGNVHAKLKLSAPPDLKFSARSPVVPLLSVEFTEAAREYPIAFLRGADGTLLPVALTGAPAGDNVYIDAAGRWNARYVPAYVRRYPFMFARTSPDQLTVCIDAAYPGFNETEGTPMFDSIGEPSPMLKQIVANLSEHQRQSTLTEVFVRRLESAGLLMEASAKANLNDGRRLDLTGFWIVDESRFRALPDATLKEWFASGEIGLIYAHLLSLGNLLELLRRQPRAAGAAADAAAAVIAGSTADANLKATASIASASDADATADTADSATDRANDAITDGADDATADSAQMTPRQQKRRRGGRHAA